MQCVKGCNGIGYICFKKSDSVGKALGLNNSNLQGRPVRVQRYIKKSVGRHNVKKPKFSDKDQHTVNEKKVKKDNSDDVIGSDSDMKNVVQTTTVTNMLRAKKDSVQNKVDNGNNSEQTENSNKMKMEELLKEESDERFEIFVLNALPLMICSCDLISDKLTMLKSQKKIKNLVRVFHINRCQILNNHHLSAVN